MDNKGISAIKIAGVYIGTVVGAGFATGQEILQFFAAFGIKGLWGILVSTLLFIVFGYIIMKTGHKLSAKSHLDILRYSGGKFFVTAMDCMISLFLFCSLTAMTAGTGALFSQQFGLPGMLGSLIMIVLTAITVLGGFGGVINAISAVVPFLMAAVIGISLFSLTKNPPSFVEYPAITGNPIIGGWAQSSVLYASYNIIMSVAVLGPLGACARDKKALRNGALLGGLGLGSASVMICLALSGNFGVIHNLEVPFMHIAAEVASGARLVYAAVLIAEIYTTAVGSLYGFFARVTSLPHAPPKVAAMLAISAAAFLASAFGFSNIVKYLYPLVGYCGAALLINLLYRETARRVAVIK